MPEKNCDQNFDVFASIKNKLEHMLTVEVTKTPKNQETLKMSGSRSTQCYT